MKVNAHSKLHYSILTCYTIKGACLHGYHILMFCMVFIVQQGFSLRTFTGHSASVMSLDFHPNKEDLICSCDGDSEIRFWSIKNGSCTRVFKVCNRTASLLVLFLSIDFISIVNDNHF